MDKGITGVLTNIEKQDLTGDDIKKICNGNVEVIAYHLLKDYDSIENLLKVHGAIILLYETKQNFGHYTALFYNKANQLEFFDSYGFKPDEELKYATFNLDNGVPYLTNLLKKYNKPIVYNNKKFQMWAKDMNTCGRWTSVRIRMRHRYDLNEFTQMFSNPKYFNGDFYVSALTYLYTSV